MKIMWQYSVDAVKRTLRPFSPDSDCGTMIRVYMTEEHTYNVRKFVGLSRVKPSVFDSELPTLYRAMSRARVLASAI